MNIRPLTTADMFAVVGMLKKITNTKLSNIFVSDDTALKGKNDTEKSISMGILVLSELYDNLTPDLQNWFASLLEKSKEEYMKMPADTTLEIIDYLIENEDAKRFFSRALQVYKKISVLGNRTVNK